MDRIIVAVSPFFGGEDWTDELTGITFKKDVNGQFAHYSISKDADLTNIRKALRLNALILITGELGAEKVVEAPKEAPKTVKVEEPVAEAEEAPAVEEKPKGKSNKKK